MICRRCHIRAFGLRMKEKVILYFIFFVFTIISLYTCFQLPQNGIKNTDNESTLGRTYTAFQRIRKTVKNSMLSAQESGNETLLTINDVNRLHIHAHNYKKLREMIQQEKEQFIKVQRAKKLSMVNKRKKEFLQTAPDPIYGILANNEPNHPDVKKKRNFIKQMMKTAWNGYEKNALGQNELKPISKVGHSAGIFGSSSMGATAVDALDTLYIMGMREEFKKARDWVAEHLSFDTNTFVSVFEMNIRFMGGLLAAYALTNDQMFKMKAKILADKLLVGFNTPTGIPWSLVNLRTGQGSNHHWASGGNSILSEIGTLHLEWVYLSKITGDPKYAAAVNRVRNLLRDADKPNGLYPNYINPRTGSWGQRHVSLGALGDSFYEYLLKSWLLSGKKDIHARKMYDDAMTAIQSAIVRTSNAGFTYLGIYNRGIVEKRMEHLACFAGGMFALGAEGAPTEEMQQKYINLSTEITRTCRQSYKVTATGIGPEAFRFEGPHEAKALRSGEKYYILRPVVVETYFIMWRLTHDQKYRDWAWHAAKNIERYCHVGDGYSGIRDVESVYVAHDDVQQSFFLAETLKYLYLIFSDDDLVPLDKWVFNTEAHILPIENTIFK